MLDTLVLVNFLSIGGLILAATCNFDYSDSYCHSPAPPELIRIDCYYSGHTGQAQVCCGVANAYRYVRRFVHIKTETWGNLEFCCTKGTKYDDCRNGTIPKGCAWYLQSWHCPLPGQDCILLPKPYIRRGHLRHVITGNYCPPDDSTAGDATRDNPSADPFDN